MDHSCFDRSVFDRTAVNRQWKVEEKELSERLYKKLQGLFILYAPGDELRRCITIDIFLKSNDQAFFHVVNYLFRLLDPIEYKKRFFWPLSDKRSEASFRASTVEYLKFLNEKYQLQWKNIKSHLVVIPGGVRFINFMLELVSFVIQELIRQQKREESSAAADASKQEPLTIKQMSQKNKLYKEYASKYIMELDKQINNFNEKILLIEDQIKVISNCLGMPESQMMDDKFLNAFNNHNREMFRENIVHPRNRILNLKDVLLKITDATGKAFVEEESKFDKSILKKSLLKVHDMVPGVDLDKGIDFKSNHLNLDILLIAFIKIYPVVEAALSTFDAIPCPNNSANNDLSGLQDEQQRLATLVAEFQSRLNENIKSQKSWPRLKINDLGISDSCSTSSNLLMARYVSTPPIKAELTDFGYKRLPLLDDVQVKTKESFLLGASRSVRKEKHNETCVDLNNTFNKTKLFNAMQMLRSITKVKPAQKQDTFMKESSWKLRQSEFGNEINSNSTGLIKRSSKICVNNLESQSLRPKPTLIAMQSPISPFGSNSDYTCIARKQIVDTHDGSPLLYAKKTTAVKKVQDASSNLQNLSTSPSGRLETLISIDTTNNSISISKESDSNSKKAQPLFEKFESNEKNSSNVAKTLKTNFENVHPDCEEDAIVNTSDSILKDISM